MGFGFAAASVLIAGIAGGTYWTTHRLVRSFDSVADSHRAIENLQSLQTLIETGQASAYNYVITGREGRLQAYRESTRSIPRKLRALESLVNDFPRQKSALRQFRRVLTLHQQYLAQMVGARDAQGFEGAAQWVAAEDDHSVRIALGMLIEEIQNDEARVLRRRAASSLKQSIHTKAALVLAALFSLALILWVFSLFRKEAGDRAEAQAASHRLDRFLRTLIERIPYAVWVREADNLRLTLVNQTAQSWMSRPEAELLGANDYDLLPHEAARISLQEDRDVLRKGDPVDIPEETWGYGGKPRILHTQKVAIPDENGAPAFLLTISEDITERKQAEHMLEMSRDAAVQSERLKSEFIRNMSHEIRTPLSIVVGMISLLQDTPLSSEQRLFASKIERSAGGLARLTREILDFSKIETGTFSLEMREMNLRDEIENSLRMWSEQARTKGIRLETLIPASVPPLLIGDPVRVRQVLTELIGNALKFTERGQIQVRVQEAEETVDQVSLTFQVSDSGIGILEDVQKHLFNPFRQGDGSPTRRFGGTGLGLAISKRIVELLGGKIGFSSAPKEGSTFWFTLPFTKPGIQPIRVEVPMLPWTRARVLVVEDNAVSRRQLQDQLSAFALSNEGVASGGAAIDLLRKEQQAGRPFQIVLLDLHLPDMEGVELARAIKAESALAATPLVVLTETTMDPTDVAELGFSASVPKPFQADTLLDRLAGLVAITVKVPRSAA
jgi:PAS domain S-box-containing protein